MLSLYSLIMGVEPTQESRRADALGTAVSVSGLWRVDDGMTFEIVDLTTSTMGIDRQERTWLEDDGRSPMIRPARAATPAAIAATDPKPDGFWRCKVTNGRL